MPGPQADLSQYLWTTEDTGPLNAGGQRISQLPITPSDEEGSASLSGPEPKFQGIGGTQTVPREKLEQQTPDYHPPPVHPRQLSPEELMFMAMQMEKDMEEQKRASEGSTAVDRALIRTNEPPSWLHQYFDKTPTTGTYVDMLDSQKYLSERDHLKRLRNERRHAGII